MDFNLTDEQQMLRDAARRFGTTQYSFEQRKHLLAAGSTSDQNWSTYAELGWLALGLPEDVGGLACSFVETAIIMQELGRVLALEPYTTSAILCAHIIDASGSPTHRSELLPELAAGNLRLALAHSEADSRYELNAVRATSARADKDGLCSERRSRRWCSMRRVRTSSSSLRQWTEASACSSFRRMLPV